MKISNKTILSVTFCAAAVSGIAQPAAPSNDAQTLAVESGIATFHVTTNVPALEVSGKSSALQARVQLHRDSSGVTLEKI